MEPDDLKELERLRRILKETIVERDRLLAENRFLIQASKNGQEPIHPQINNSVSAFLEPDKRDTIGGSTVNNESSISDKIYSFRSLFNGRGDTYAKIFQSAGSDKPGYMPACIHEWEPPLCQKPNIKCRDCSNRELAPLTDGVIENHLRGKAMI